MKREPVILEKALLPFRMFAAKEASGGIVLLVAMIVALIWANSPWALTYKMLWKLDVAVSFGDFALRESLLHWINDGLMAMFFFTVGLEIKREVIAGELSSPRQAALPIFAAMGGMVVPAGIYALFNVGLPTSIGWGIPMATDIAFALGILMLLGKRVPLSLKIFLTALAIVDDLGAVLAIAIFYTSKISLFNLAIGGIFLTALVVSNRIGVRNPWVYAAFGIGGLWLAFLFSGVHATVAGVLAALTIPARTKLDHKSFLTEARKTLEQFENADEHPTDYTDKHELASLLELRVACENATTPLARLEKQLHPWVIFFVLPLFALANTGIKLDVSSLPLLLDRVVLGIVCGLVIGKQLGIFGFSWLAVRFGWSELPTGTNWKHVYAVSCFGGIGLTMSLFIATLAFTSATTLNAAKLGILLASILSALIGIAVFRLVTPTQPIKRNEVIVPQAPLSF